jgi:hypothetical protein
MDDGYRLLNVGPICDHLDKDNINYLNPYINETTAMYHIWKNCNDEYVGLAHYRRGFVDPNNVNRVLPFDTAKEILKCRDIICTPYHTFGKYTMLEYFRFCMKGTSKECLEVFNIIYDKLVSKEPDIDKYFSTTTEFIARNMFICKKEVFDRYCEWLFPIIIPITEDFRDNYIERAKGEERMIGHICERLFSYWMDYKEDLVKFHCHYYTKNI